MLNNISWQGYWLTIALFAAGYYLSIYLLYFRNDFKIVFPSKLRLPGQTIRQGDGTTKSFETATLDQAEHLSDACLDEIQAYFLQAKRSKCVKEDVLYAIQRILSKYPSLKTTSYQDSITTIIRSESEHICSIHLSAEEVLQVWLDE
jgi:hypothetical protein